MVYVAKITVAKWSAGLTYYSMIWWGLSMHGKKAWCRFFSHSFYMHYYSPHEVAFCMLSNPSTPTPIHPAPPATSKSVVDRPRKRGEYDGAKTLSNSLITIWGRKHVGKIKNNTFKKGMPDEGRNLFSLWGKTWLS